MQIPEDFGYHNEQWVVDLCYTCAERWGWTPEETIQQNLDLVYDMMTRANIESALRDADEGEVSMLRRRTDDWQPQASKRADNPEDDDMLEFEF